MYVPPIEDIKYNERNYLKRSIVRLNEVENAKGGDVIEFLSKPRTYAGGHRHVTSKGPIFQKDRDNQLTTIAAQQLDSSTNISVSRRDTKSINLPELVTSPVRKQAEQSSRNMNAKRNNSVAVPVAQR